MILPMTIDNTDNPITRADMLPYAGFITPIRSFISTPKAATFDPPAKNAVTGVGAPSYISGDHI
jgi:hypothetical protein